MGVIIKFIRKVYTNMGKKSNETENLGQKLTLVIHSGKYKIGYKLAKKALRNGNSKLMVIASNCPAVRKTELEYSSVLGSSKVLHWDGTNVELGTACGRLHRVCVLTIQDAGDSDILQTL